MSWNYTISYQSEISKNIESSLNLKRSSSGVLIFTPGQFFWLLQKTGSLDKK